MLHALRCCVLVLCTAGALAAARAQSPYPERPIHLVVAFTPGGGTDVAARQISEDLKRVLGQPVIVENKPGAAGAIGWNYVASSDADGYTVLLAENALAMGPSLYKRAGFDPLRQLDAVCHVATSAMVVVVSNKVPANSWAEFVAFSKATPGKLTYSSSGIGSVSHLFFEVLKKGAGVDALHVPYKGGGQAIADVVAGHIDATIATIPVAKSLIDAGQVKGLAVTSAERSAVLPGVPTLKEAAVNTAGVDLQFWWGLFGPAGMPADVKDKLGDAVSTIMQDAQLRERFAKLNLEPAHAPGSVMKAKLVSEIANWSKFVDDNGIKAE